MKQIDLIMKAVDVAQEIVTGHAPKPVPYWPVPGAEVLPFETANSENNSGVADSNILLQELDALRHEVASLRQELHSRVSGELFHQFQENVSAQISGVWQYLSGNGGGADRFLSFSAMLARDIAERDVVSGHARFCEAILVAIGLTDRSEWTSLYWNNPHTAPLITDQNYAFLDKIARSGLIQLPEQAEAIDDVGFVTVCYAVILGRRPDPIGLSDHTKRLKEGISRNEVVAQFQQSEEAAALSARLRGITTIVNGRNSPTASAAFWTDLYKLSRAFA